MAYDCGRNIERSKTETQKENREYLLRRTIKILYARSGYQCAFRECGDTRCHKIFLDDDEREIEDIFHIESIDASNIRYNPRLSEDDYHDIKNLMLLCPHHRDWLKNNRNYTTKNLRDMKMESEEPVALYLRTYEGIKFLKKLNKIFNEYNYDDIFDKLDRCSLPVSTYVDIEERIKNSCEMIKGLSKKKCVINMPKGFEDKFLLFAGRLQRLMEYISSKSECCDANGEVELLYKASDEGVKDVQRLLSALNMEYRMYRNTYKKVCGLTD